ncbi:SpoIIE family protein phosphatase [candidate division KSB1 bacterium]|nr:SpoIIE family protein phosphatase [candidate division KSB1 bacterium]NIR69835.1 SpoIIE family protein phosphatase [candidate division KSB1 bacterium]NIS24382.1 SpoIIE family protein phosphatase [candidate division KSB1 bacterium]NIT71318.1 SpoIIE family protein phosphatase [candidate division KSB1 bacterium]NIU27613.1 SpoIIE family protein phosphatase [candidate division KSB1 bacterium]
MKKDEFKQSPEFTELDEKLYELQALFDLSKALNSSLNLKEILNTILLTPMGKMMIGKGTVLVASDSDKFVIEALKGLPKSNLGTSVQIDDLPLNPEFIDDLRPTPWQAFLKKNDIELVIPIIHDDKRLGLIGFGKKILGTRYADSELEYLSSLSNIAATAVQNGLIHDQLKAAKRQLDKKYQELNTINEIGKELNSNLLDPEAVVNLLGYSIMGELMVNRCLIFLNANGKMTLKLNKGFQTEEGMKLTTDETFLRELSHLHQPINIEDEEDGELLGKLQESGVRVVVPMRIQGETKGVIALGEKITKSPFLKEEIDFLTTLGNSSIISIENAILFEERLERQRLEEELQIASDIQKQLLPDSCPQIEGFQIAASNVSSRQVGGDYYDCFKIDDTRYGFCIADVSGKGAPAALLMSNLQASLHSLVTTGLEIDKITARINELIYENTSYDKFITFFLGILDVETKTFKSVNAGHNPPYLFHSDKSFQTLQEGGLILGMMPNVQYKTETVNLKSGDCIVMFTDGVSEAMNTEEKEFEEKRIEACIQETYELSAEKIMQSLKTAVKEFSKGMPQADDITMLIVKVF